MNPKPRHGIKGKIFTIGSKENVQGQTRTWKCTEYKRRQSFINKYPSDLTSVVSKHNLIAIFFLLTFLRAAERKLKKKEVEYVQHAMFSF